jgi:DNA polymerase-3 subunit delta'
MNSFNDVIGHKDIISHMKNAYTMGKVSHAYILEGDEGMGKKLLTNCFVKLLQCENPIGTSPCGSCSSCVQIDSNNHPDIIYVKPSKISGYGVDDVRTQIVKDINIKPYQSKYKIYIIDEADKMNVQAQNSILKTIEDPPSYGLFFLLATNSQKFLQTVLSRAVKMNLKPVSIKHIERYLLKEWGVSTTQAKVFSSFSRGNLGKALKLQGSESFTNNREEMVKLLDIFINGKEYDIMDAVKLLENHKEDINEILEILISLIRDILFYKETLSNEGIIHQDIEVRIVKLSQNVKPIKLVRLVQNIYELTSQLRLNVNYSPSILTMLTNV